MPAPTPTYETFVERFPQFENAPRAFVEAWLAAGARRTNQKVFQSGDLVQDAVMLKAAILLLRAPAAQKMRINVQPEQGLAWEYELAQLQGSATLGFRVF